MCAVGVWAKNFAGYGNRAAMTQFGERQTEDLKVSSIPSLGTFCKLRVAVPQSYLVLAVEGPGEELRKEVFRMASSDHPARIYAEA